MDIGQDYQEGRLTVRMHRVQIQNATTFEALQAVRSFNVIRFSLHVVLHFCVISFELGGDKKTKGAALTFVSGYFSS